MPVFQLLFVLLALVLFGLATFNVPSARFSLIAAGLFSLTLALALALPVFQAAAH